MTRPAIDTEFAELCPPLSPEELNLLEMSLVEEGCRDALVVWKQEGLLLDGHNRIDLCERNGVGFKTRELSLPSREAAIEWIIANQLGRRNLSKEQKDYLRGKRYKHAEKQQGKRTDLTSGHNVLKSDRAKIADELGVSEKTLVRDAEFATAVDTLAKNVGKEVKAEILSGKSGLSKKDVVAIASAPASKQTQAVKAAKVKSPPSVSAVKSDIDKLLERIEQLVESVNRMAAHQMGHNKQSAALVDHLQGAVPLVKSMQKSWRN